MNWYAETRSPNDFEGSQIVVMTSACRGTTGQGATWPPSFWRKHASTDQADTVLNYLVRAAFLITFEPDHRSTSLIPAPLLSLSRCLSVWPHTAQR